MTSPAYFNTDQTGGVERLNAYLAKIDGGKKPFPCPWLRVLPEELVTEVIGRRETHKAGAFYCTELKAPCQVKGKVLYTHAKEDGKPLIGIECLAGHQLVVSIDSFLPVKRTEDLFRQDLNA